MLPQDQLILSHNVVLVVSYTDEGDIIRYQVLGAVRTKKDITPADEEVMLGDIGRILNDPNYQSTELDEEDILEILNDRGKFKPYAVVNAGNGVVKRLWRDQNVVYGEAYLLFYF